MNLKKSRVAARQQLDEVLLKSSDFIMKEASLILGRQIVLNLKRQDQLRLLNIFCWSEKYSLPVSEVLSVLLKVWGGRFKSRSVRGLGVAISTLAGPKSKQILKDYLKKQYPGSENLVIRKQEVLNTLYPQIDISKREDPLEFIKNYRKNLKTEKDKVYEVEDKLKRRRWRNNPVY